MGLAGTPLYPPSPSPPPRSQMQTNLIKRLKYIWLWSHQQVDFLLVFINVRNNYFLCDVDLVINGTNLFIIYHTMIINRLSNPANLIKLDKKGHFWFYVI